MYFVLKFEPFSYCIKFSVFMSTHITFLRDSIYDRGSLQRKFSEQNIGAPPSYEEAVSESRSPVYSERCQFSFFMPVIRTVTISALYLQIDIKL